MKSKRYSFVVALAVVALACGTSFAVSTGEYLLDGNANDTSGLGRNGTIVGASTFGAGLYMNSGNALVQNANGQSITLPASTDFIRNAPGATLMAWVRPDGAVNGTQTILVVNNGDATQGGGIGAARANIQIAGGQFRAIGRQADTGGSSNAVGGTPVVGTTFFVAGVFEYATQAVRIYVNGQQAGSTTVAAWNVPSADTANLVARIGSNADGVTESWIGAIDGARIFNSALTATEILDIYNAETFPPPILGDTDNDGFVEPEDLTPIRTNWRLTGQTRLQGNLSGDTAGLVNFADFRQWKTAILLGGGSLAGLDLGFMSVPEPSAMLLLLLGSLGLFRCRTVRRGR